MAPLFINEAEEKVLEDVQEEQDNAQVNLPDEFEEDN